MSKADQYFKTLPQLIQLHNDLIREFEKVTDKVQRILNDTDILPVTKNSVMMACQDITSFQGLKLQEFEISLGTMREMLTMTAVFDNDQTARKTQEIKSAIVKMTNTTKSIHHDIEVMWDALNRKLNEVGD